MGWTNVSPTAYQWVGNDGNADTDIEDATGLDLRSLRRRRGQDHQGAGDLHRRCRNNEETLTSAATAAVAARPNSPATGLPTISGTPQVEQTLTADTSGIADADGLTNVSYRYQWIRNDGTNDSEIGGQTGSSYDPAHQQRAMDKTIQVRVSFTDDAENEETLTSEATVAVVAAPDADTPAQPGECRNHPAERPRLDETLRRSGSRRGIHADATTG